MVFHLELLKTRLYFKLHIPTRIESSIKNDVVKFEFESGEWLEFKLISGTIKDFNNLNSAVILIKPEQVKLFLFENLKSIEIRSKRNEIGYKNSDLIQTLK